MAGVRDLVVPGITDLEHKIGGGVELDLQVNLETHGIDLVAYHPATKRTVREQVMSMRELESRPDWVAFADRCEKIARSVLPSKEAQAGGIERTVEG